MQELYELVRKIPKGKISTYKELSRALKIHPRTIGKILNKNYNREIPCYKIVLSSGFIGRYNKGIKKKISLLNKDGIKIKSDRIVNFEEALFRF